METGVQFRNITNIKDVKQAGFQHIELPYEAVEQYIQMDLIHKLPVTGIVKEAVGLQQEDFQGLFAQALSMSAEYVILETEKLHSVEELKLFLLDNLGMIKKHQIPVYIENGIFYDGLVDTDVLMEFTDNLNHAAGAKWFGICLNTGHANLLGKNICTMIEELGNRIKVVHANDNDGIHDLHQMPYSFTTGRGTLSTGWYQVIRGLVRIGYQGALVFDTYGLFYGAPSKLHGIMLKLLAELAKEWDRQLSFEVVLDQKGKQIILFGAGNMFCNYMKVWGNKYPPVFIVDNNSTIWGEKRLGIEVRPPEAILEIDEEKRNVLICNMYYRQIEAQLGKMGVDAGWYDDNYFM